MSSALSLRPNDYVACIMLTAVGYDYILTFSDELEYVWNRPWTWVSVSFVLARYVGIYSLVASSLVGSSFLGPAKVFFLQAFMTAVILVIIDVRHIIGVTNDWAFCLFFGAADLVMLLRVWALYSLSRPVLGTLMTLFFLEIIYIIVPTAIYSASSAIPAIAASQKPNCAVVLPPVSTKVGSALQIVNGTTLCALAIVQFAMQSLQMYRLTKRFQVNRYMDLIVKQGVLYFFVNLLRMANILHVVAFTNKFPRRGWQLMVLAAVQYVPMFILIPRFIMSIRALYARDVSGRGSEGIDAGFGLSSSIDGVDGMGMVFADVEQSGELENTEQIAMGVAPAQTR